MRILVTGRGTSASWQIRGVQLGNALGATVCRDAPQDVLDAHNVIIAVKRVSPDLATRLKKASRKARVVWDCVDWYSQPCTQTLGQLVHEAHAYARAMGAHALVGATRAMADDLGSPHFIPHHAWDRGHVDPTRPIRTVCYEGSERYIEPYRGLIGKECAARGWQFVVNPKSFIACDAALALRAPRWGGEVVTRWKSAVKLANAQSAGMPFIALRECGYLEQSSGAERFIDDISELRAAFDWLAKVDRVAVSRDMRAKTFTLDEAAQCMRAVLKSS